ncbi:MAG: TM2 domain-containing protein [Sneathiellaceae bacterium]
MAGPPPPVRVYCARCGAGMLSDTALCPACSAPNLAAARPAEPSSDRSYSLAVMLCGIFGIVGIHHFYMGNWLHGLFDLGLFLVAVYILAFSAADGDGWMAIGLLLLAVDFLHTMIVFYRLIAGKARDGQGRPIAVPTARP